MTTPPNCRQPGKYRWLLGGLMSPPYKFGADYERAAPYIYINFMAK